MTEFDCFICKKGRITVKHVTQIRSPKKDVNVFGEV